MGMERDLLTLSQMQRPKDLQMLRPMPRPNHGGMGTTDMDGLTTLATTIMERDLLTLKDLLMLRLMPRPSHGGTGTTDMDGLTTLATTIMERDLPMLLPLLMPRLNLGTMAHMDGPIMVATTGTERDLLTQSPLQWLMPRLSHGIMAAMDTLGHTMVATGMERGLLTPSPLLMLRLRHGILAAMDMGGRTTLATTIMERGRLTLNQLLLPMPRQSHGGMDTTDTHGHTMVMPTMERDLLTLNQ